MRPEEPSLPATYYSSKKWDHSLTKGLFDARIGGNRLAHGQVFCDAFAVRGRQPRPAQDVPVDVARLGVAAEVGQGRRQLVFGAPGVHRVIDVGEMIAGRANGGGLAREDLRQRVLP